MKILVVGKEGRLAQYVPQWIELSQYEIAYVNPWGTDEDILKAGKDADFMLVDAMARVSREVIFAMPNLKMIHSEGGGFNYFDIEAAREKGITHITLEATDMGRPLYEKYGFTKMNDEMQFPE